MFKDSKKLHLIFMYCGAILFTGSDWLISIGSYLTKSDWLRSSKTEGTTCGECEVNRDSEPLEDQNSVFIKVAHGDATVNIFAFALVSPLNLGTNVDIDGDVNITCEGLTGRNVLGDVFFRKKG